MPQIITGTVGPQLNTGDGSTPPGGLRQGRGGEMVVTEYHGKYYEQNYRGNTYMASTAAAGAVVPLFSTAAQQFLVYNPPGSGVNCVPNRVIVGYVSGTSAAGHLCIGHSLTVQAAPGTATLAPVYNGKVGAAAAAGKVAIYTPASPVTALTYHSPLDLSFMVQPATGTNNPVKMAMDFDGSIICPPGGMFSIAGNIAVLFTVVITLLWEEIPI
jgi:hypothetical protein